MTTTTTAETDSNDARIENYIEVTHALARVTHMMPDGTERAAVDNPRSMDPYAKPPKYLRVAVHRKGFTFKVIDEAESLGLVVADVWQWDADKENDEIMLRLERPSRGR